MYFTWLLCSLYVLYAGIISCRAEMMICLTDSSKMLELSRFRQSMRIRVRT